MVYRASSETALEDLMNSMKTTILNNLGALVITVWKSTFLKLFSQSRLVRHHHLACYSILIYHLYYNINNFEYSFIAKNYHIMYYTNKLHSDKKNASFIYIFHTQFLALCSALKWCINLGKQKPFRSYGDFCNITIRLSVHLFFFTSVVTFCFSFTAFVMLSFIWIFVGLSHPNFHIVSTAWPTS